MKISQVNGYTPGFGKFVKVDTANPYDTHINTNSISSYDIKDQKFAGGYDSKNNMNKGAWKATAIIKMNNSDTFKKQFESAQQKYPCEAGERMAKWDEDQVSNDPRYQQFVKGCIDELNGFDRTA